MFAKRWAWVVAVSAWAVIAACGDDETQNPNNPSGDGGTNDGSSSSTSSTSSSSSTSSGGGASSTSSGGSSTSSGGSSSGDGGNDGGPLPEAGPPGLDTRPANTTCLAPARPPTGGGTNQINFTAAFPNMNFNGQAIGLIRTRMGATGPLRWFVFERLGDIWMFTDENASKDGLAANGTTPVEQAVKFFDLPTNVYGATEEGGMLGVAFDPNFGVSNDSNYVYVHYTTYPQNNVWRFRIGPAPTFTVLESTRIFTAQSGGGNHWGGDLKFGPDGFLYISLGDGGNGFDNTRAQSKSWLRGKILRIDPRSVGTGYAIPGTNPFAGGSQCDNLSTATLEARAADCPEVYAFGFRNPWRMTFDRDTGQLWVGDVGTGKEEVNLVRPGANYGWPVCDGQAGAGCAGKIKPVAQYREFTMPNASVTGGFVYRGTQLGTALQGTYIFTDVYSGNLFVLDTPYANVENPFNITTTYEHPAATDFPALPKFRVIAGTALPYLVSFAEDENAELLAVTFGSGKGQGVFRLTPAGTPPADTIPNLLSQTGCANPADPKQPSSGMIPYDLNAPFWSDGAEKTRWLAIPDGTTITVNNGAGVAGGDFDFPNNAVMRKDFRVNGKLIETRLFVRHLDGGWAGYSYVWNDSETDATKANPAGENRTITAASGTGTQTWRYPSRAQCLVCHTQTAGSTLGLETRQLNREITYPTTGRAGNQIDTLAAIGMFTASPGVGAGLPAFVNPFGTAPLADRARTYLHANCTSCHRSGAKPGLLFDNSMAETQLCAAPALVVPGSPGTSPIIARMRHADLGQRMPKNAGNVIDEQGVTLIENWITSLTACP